MDEVYSFVGRADATIFEVGSADGLDSLRFLSTFKDEAFRLHCFEPDPRHWRALQEKLNDPRVHLNSSAIGDRIGEAVFYQTSTIYSSSLKQPNLPTLQEQWPAVSLAQEIPVKVTTLDRYCQEQSIDRIDFLWADVQGGEDLLIRGGRSSFSSAVRYFYTEYSDTAYYQDEPTLDEIKKLLGNDYALVRDFGTDALFLNTSHNTH